MSDGRDIEVAGFFADEESAVRAIHDVRAAGFGRPRAYSPFPSAEILEAVGYDRSPVRAWVLAGGIFGAASGFALTIGLSTAWYPRVVAAMPYVSVPPFVIIAFEMMILFGALAGTTGYLFHGGFPALEAFPGFDPRFTDDRFGVVVSCVAGRASEAESRLRQAGAEEVTRAEA
jgi:molybdopterin-containing oxidoreductase family membrane subunit